MKPIAAVAFCADLTMEVALHVAASSVLRHLDDAYHPKLYVLSDNFPCRDVKMLRRTLNKVGRPYDLIVIQSPDTDVFNGLRPFHGSYAAYYRLLLPAVVAEDRFVYLDLDTITNLDLSPLFTKDMQGHAMGFVVDGKMGWSLESEFYKSLGFERDDPAFNSGVMLFDKKRWNELRCFDRVMIFCHRYPDKLLAADQTALNAVFSKSCAHLEGFYNEKLYPNMPTRTLPYRAVYHLVGSPKPWDVFAEFFHPYYDLWKDGIEGISISSLQKNPYLTWRSWARFPKIVGGYRRALLQRMRSGFTTREEALTDQEP